MILNTDPVDISDETKSFVDKISLDSISPVSNIKLLRIRIYKKMSTLSTSDIEIWVNKTLQEIDSLLLKLNYKLFSDMPLVIKNKYSLVLKSLELQKKLFKKMKVFMFVVMNSINNRERTYLELMKTLSSLNKSFKEVIAHTQTLQNELLNFKQKFNN